MLALTAELAAQVESWHPCPHIPGCIVVNVGDSLQAWSDGVLKSNYHRVRMPKPGEPTVRCLPLLRTGRTMLAHSPSCDTAALASARAHAQPWGASGHSLSPEHQHSIGSAAAQPVLPHSKCLPMRSEVARSAGCVGYCLLSRAALCDSL